MIHSRAKIGKNCIIAQQVTVGGRSKIQDVPFIGDNVYIGAGAKVLGNITIGNECVIGANAVVIHSVESGSVVAGVPCESYSCRNNYERLCIIAISRRMENWSQINSCSRTKNLFPSILILALFSHIFIYYYNVLTGMYPR